MGVFAPEQLAALLRWQGCGWAHELTCANGHGALTVAAHGLYCTHPGCGYVQTWAPEMCFGPLPPSPEEIFKMKAQP